MLLGPYVGRTYEQRCYREFLTRETPWMLVIRGLGGSGKSTLLSLLEKQTPPNTCVVKLDFAQPTLRSDSLTLLREFSDMVKPYCNAQKARDFAERELYCRNEIGKRVSSGNTQIDQLKQELKFGNDAEVSKTDVRIEVGGTNIQETRCQMRAIATEAFYGQIETFTLTRLVLMLDSCEWLSEETAETEAARWAAAELAKGLYFRMRNQGQQCFVVLASRLPLQLVGIDASEQEQLRLKMLERADVNQYLEGIGIHDPAIQDYVYNMTYGHPHSLSLVHDILEEDWDEPLSIADLPALQGEFFERALQDVVDRDILKPLLKPPLNLLTQYGVLLHRFNLPLLQAVFKEWLPESEANNWFRQLVRYPHVKSLGNFNYVFHKLLREILGGIYSRARARKVETLSSTGIRLSWFKGGVIPGIATLA